MMNRMVSRILAAIFAIAALSLAGKYVCISIPFFCFVVGIVSYTQGYWIATQKSSSFISR